MGINLSSLVQTASGAVNRQREMQIEDEQRQRQRDMAILQQQLMAAQIGKLQSQSQGVASTAKAYLQQYPELQPFASDPNEVIARGRLRDQEGLIRERPVADYAVVGPNGEVYMVPREKEQTNLRPIQQQQPAQAPASAQGISGSTVGSQAPIQAPAQQAPSQVPRPARRPRGTGVQRFQPGLITPSQGELDAAQWAPGVVQGFTEFRNAYRATPRAVAEAVPFLQALDITASIPGLGNAISGAVRGAAQAGLSKEAQQAVQGFLRWTASRVFATGGKQLTQNEIRAAIGQYLPAIGEDPSVTEQRLISMAQDATNVLQSTGRAYPRIKQNLLQAGAPDLGDFDPYTQTFTGNVTFQDLLGPAPVVPKPGRYGYTRPQ